MATAHIPPPPLATPPPTVLSDLGIPTMPWPQWRHVFERYMLALDYQNLPAARQRALLLHCLGAEGQRIFYTLPEELGSTDVYEKAWTALDKYFKASVSVVAERYRFYQRAQRPEENVDSYIAALCELVVSCGFGDRADEMMRDQFVVKTNSSRIRKRLLMDPYLTLDKAIRIARHVEQALKHSNSSKPVNAVKQRNYKKNYSGHNKEDRVCFRCGSCDHIASYTECKAKNTTCAYCLKVGHFETVCLSRKDAAG